MTCCLGSSDEEINEEPSLYDCERCPVADALDGLDDENRETWQIYNQAISRFAVETHTVPLVLQDALAEMTTDARIDTMQRLALLYDVLSPPRGDSRGA